MWRSFEYTGDEIGWFFAILEAHQVFEGKDPYWSPTVEKAAAENGYEANAQGKMIHPEDYEAQKSAQNGKLLDMFTALMGVDLKDYTPPK